MDKGVDTSHLIAFLNVKPTSIAYLLVFEKIIGEKQCAQHTISSGSYRREEEGNRQNICSN